MKTLRSILPYLFAVYFGIAAYGHAQAESYNRFQPANGVLVGNTSTYVTTAATSSNITGLWSGTCNSSTFLRGDGACGTPAGTGVTSVALTVPSGLSVAGSPVTSSGTLAVSTTLNGVVHGNGSGFTASNVALGSEVTGTLPVANGGTGAATLTGPLKGNGTSAIGAAASSDIIGLWSGTCNSSTFLRGDGSCQSPGGGGTVTSVTAGTGLTASPNPIISSGTVSLDLAAANTWTAQTLFTVTGSTASPMLGLRSAFSNLEFDETDGSTDNKNWAIAANGEQLLFRAVNDARNTASDFMTVDRTGTTIDSVTFTGREIFSGNTSGITTPNVQLTAPASGVPSALEFYMPAAATNEKVWQLFANNTQFSVAAPTDARASPANAMLATRSGATISSVSFPTAAAASFLVGTSSSINGSSVMNVLAPAATAAAVFATPTFSAAQIFQWNQATAGDNVFTTFFTEGTITSRASIDYNRAGNAVRYNTTSDRRLKSAIADAGSASSIIDAIKVRQYDWKEPGHAHVRYGFVAQELNEVAPEAVSAGDSSGETITKTWGVDSSKLVPLMMKELQDLRKRVADLEAAQAQRPSLIQIPVGLDSAALH